jgi:hypothetical protein
MRPRAVGRSAVRSVSLFNDMTFIAMSGGLTEAHGGFTIARRKGDHRKLMTQVRNMSGTNQFVFASHATTGITYGGQGYATPEEDGLASSPLQ